MDRNPSVAKPESMQIEQNNQFLQMMTMTSLKYDECFDYNLHDSSNASFKFHNHTLTQRFIYMYKDQKTKETRTAVSLKFESIQMKGLELLCGVHIKEKDGKVFAQFYNAWEVEESRGISSKNKKKNDEVFLVVRSLKDKEGKPLGYNLKPGHVLRLGKVFYRITSPENVLKSTQNKLVIPKDYNSEQQCKYCLSRQGCSQSDFIMNPCICKGSCGAVHFQCLRQWNSKNVKRTMLTEYAMKYELQKVSCEVCKTEFPRVIEKDNKKYSLFAVPKYEQKNLVIENISEGDNYTIISKLPVDGVVFGRDPEAMIYTKNQTVSRQHAKIITDGNKITVFDMKSHYGTLVNESRLTFEVSEISKAVQVKNTVIMFQLKKKSDMLKN